MLTVHRDFVETVNPGGKDFSSSEIQTTPWVGNVGTNVPNESVDFTFVLCSVKNIGTVITKCFLTYTRYPK